MTEAEKYLIPGKEVEEVRIEAGELLGHLTTAVGSADTTIQVDWLHPEDDHILSVVLDAGTWSAELIDLSRSGGSDPSIVYVRGRGLAKTNAVAHCAGAYVHEALKVTRSRYRVQ